MTLLFTHQDMAQITGGHWAAGHMPLQSPSHLAINSKELGPSGCFVALMGTKVDGHDFVVDLEADKNQMALTSQMVAGATVPQLVVDDVLEALTALARFAAQQTKAVKIAITGSAGKTGTKEILAIGLSGFGKTYATKGNLNNHIGLPLTLANLPADSQFCVAEMGMNHAGEIRALSQIFHPDIAIITTISAAHIGHFDGLSGIADAKAEIFEGFDKKGLAILPRDNAFFEHLKRLAVKHGADQILSFGTDETSDIRLIDARPDQTGQSLVLTIADASLGGRLGMTARHWAVNSLSFMAVCHHLGLDKQAGLNALSEMQDLPGRGGRAMYQTNSHLCMLIDDAYNANPESMMAALSELGRQTGGHKGAILSDILELGSFANEAHSALKTEIEQAGITHLIAIGPYMTSLAQTLDKAISVQCFENWRDALSSAQDMLGQANVILIKGSHGSGAHHIAADLMAVAEKISTRSGGEPHVA